MHDTELGPLLPPMTRSYVIKAGEMVLKVIASAVCCCMMSETKIDDWLVRKLLVLIGYSNPRRRTLNEVNCGSGIAQLDTIPDKGLAAGI